jgi:uncharacterized protein (TIGR04551 family)
MRYLWSWTLLLAMLLATPAFAQEVPDDVDVEDAGDDNGGEGDELLESDDVPSLIDQVKQEARGQAATPTPPLKKYPHVDWHGYFRFRADLFTDADLNTYLAKSQNEFVGTSLFLPPLVDNYTNSSGGATFADKLEKQSEKTLATANMRLRVSPTIRLGDNLRVHTTVDLLDNIVLGSTPEYLGNVDGGLNHYSGFPGPGIALDTFTATQVPPAANVNALSDSIRVKEAWAEWVLAFGNGADPFSLGRIRLGRFAYDWGLGIVTSRGDYRREDGSLTTMERFRALDAEWGNYLDRAMYDLDLGPLSLMGGFAWLATGPTSRVRYDGTTQPYDIEQEDDLWQLELALYSRPESRRDFIDRRKALFSGKPVIDWGLYVTFRRQSMTSTGPDGEAVAAAGDYTSEYDQWALADRDAWLLTPDLWLRMDWRPDPRSRYYLGLEAAAVVGNVGFAPGLDATDPSTEVEVMQWGAALESNITLGAVSFGLDMGAASGDSADNWEAMLGQNTPWGADNKLGAFAFNRNYIVDLLLYREVLGTVSNSLYFRPHFDFDVIPTEEDAFGGALSALYAMALEPDAYPGNDRNLGLELDAHIFYEQSNRFLATAGFGAMFPFGALDRPENFVFDGITAKEADWAWTLQGNLYLVF